MTSSRAPSPAGGAAVDAPAHARTFYGPFVVLVGIVLASAWQTEAASYMASTLGFDKPYFSFFVTHASFTLVFPVHLLVLALRSGPRGARARAKGLLRNLRAVLADQFGTAPRWRALARPLTRKITPLTLLISAPALCWYIAMAFSPAMDITAIYATSAFHAYFFSLLLLGTRLTRTTVLAIALAFAGVIVLTLDGTSPGEMGKGRVFGDLVMVVGAVLLGLYEVVYKMVLPESPAEPRHAHARHDAESGRRSLDAPPTPSIVSEPESDDEDNDIALGSGSAPRPQRQGSRTPLLPKGDMPNGETNGDSTPPGHYAPLQPPAVGHHARLPQLPEAFHANFLTSAIGFATLVLLWVPIPILSWTGVEPYVQPRGAKLLGILVVVCAGGSIYNAGLMVLIGIWGPTTSSVANLLTIGLVAIIDTVWMGRMPTIQTLAGACMICVGFAVLLWEGEGE
ncbi:uncharacterized protein LOC62_01G000506 [Vanrija pseudolonga]|uniref:EamA domain-containing protein n=1 Tax=Vanrija pseudolonga TaxID=143232 RepID=A0AAF0XZC5_9TREE|nr:hypothetical protein LOC62_01G000506 [Vanrija pseudolonga]